jgi:hypothetical protein
MGPGKSLCPPGALLVLSSRKPKISKLIFDSLWTCFEVAHNDIDGLHLVFLDFSQNVVPKK